MKKQQIALRLENPCTQKWSEMTPVEKGRFCNSCQKNVIDVTALTDNEILKLIEQNPQGFCGQFRSTQLERALINTQLNGNGSRLNAFVAGVMIALGAGVASAQSAPTSTVQTQVIDQKNPTGPVCIRETSRDTSEQRIEVFVHADSLKGGPVHSAAVRISGTNTIVYTDSTGKATLIIPADHKADSIILSVSYIGYSTEFVSVTPRSNSETVEVVLEERYVMMGGAVSIITTVPEPKEQKKEKRVSRNNNNR